MNRREFLKTSLSGLAYFTTASTVPLWLAKSAQAACVNGVPDDRILVIYEQSGGNDGLNTLIPYTDPKYYLPANEGGLRPKLNISTGIELGDGLNALHPQLPQLKNWFDTGAVAFVQNVGYPNSWLSHFVGFDQVSLGVSPSSSLKTTQGWISRFFDNQCDGAPPDMIGALSMMASGVGKPPLILSGSPNFSAAAVRDFDSFHIEAPSPEEYGQHVVEFITKLTNAGSFQVNSELDFIQRASNLTRVAIDDMAIAAQVPLLNQYPGFSEQSLPIKSDKMGPGLEMVSKIIRAEQFDTKIFYVQQGGYDTHATQLDAHASLLNEADASLNAFLSDMNQSGHLDRIVLMSLSEFGRRPQENGSGGTDHGTANCLFIAGGEGVIGGIYGGQPDLDNLLDGNQGGNVQPQIDFRSVFSVILRDWLGVDPEIVFGTADFTNPSFNIEGGMDTIRFINENAGVDLDTVWVDENYTGFETGSIDRPYRVLSDALDRVNIGGTAKLKAGSRVLDTPRTILKPVRLEAG